MPITSTSTPSLFSQLPPTTASHSSPCIDLRTRSESVGPAGCGAGCENSGNGMGSGSDTGSGGGSVSTLRHEQIAGGSGRARPQNEHNFTDSQIRGASGSQTTGSGATGLGGVG